MSAPQIRHLLLLTLVIASIVAAACNDDDAEHPTPRPLPSPVAIGEQPVGLFQLGDPAFDALPGATAAFGRLGGTNYQIEMPDEWNGKLVIYIHGNDQDETLQVYPPPNRRALIRDGYAWASSSFSVNTVYVSGRAADESAALWDLFAQKHGQPRRAYVMGDSMGGASTITSAERYGDRYDGALALCGDAPPISYPGDLFVVAAYAAGVTQEEFDTRDLGELVANKIRPALRDPAIGRHFEEVWISLTGGPRPFAREGLALQFDFVWDIFLGNIPGRFYGNADKTYKLGESAGVSGDEFNRDAIRFTKERETEYEAGNVVTGNIQIPLLAVQTTGDVATVFSEIQELRRRVESAGKADLLVLRAVQSPRHCFDRGVISTELNDAFEDLVEWVEKGRKPDGEDLTGDVKNGGERFTLVPRIGSADADDVIGANKRLTLRGAIALDGQAVENAFVWAMVRKDGLLRTCSYEPARLSRGQYQLTLAADEEASGCGREGATVYVLLFKDEKRYIAQQTLDWPAGREASLDVTFSTHDQLGAANESSEEQFWGTDFFGDLLDADGGPLPPGTIVEAHVGDTLCGRYSVPRVLMVFNDPGNYDLSVASPESVSGCPAGVTVTFRGDGQTLAQTGKHDVRRMGHYLDLVVP